ncbi:alpha/beta hydrolase [Polymorphobacter megasporae]|uniref:alpha/beta hydrolase n=1 Tax=Glacieibacterium megasporae TaxID=2835787 RepID=UPI001C1E072E|nr:alpha/beta hydrolase [Polymorphobacter megasporae]UAJ10871.1 alpha/beta hydrolase [Polymorphobacter megasporae]
MRIADTVRGRRGRLQSGLIGVALLLVSAPVAAAEAPANSAARSETGELADGASWRATVPPNWNGTLLLWSHGYARTRPAAEDAPAASRAALLAAGYALAGSSYAEGGWALATAIPDQEATITAFAERFSRPKRTIAWGYSMGALVTVALAERPRRLIDGALPMCGSIGGAVGMMNMALDGAYAFRTLLAPDSAIRLTGIDNDLDNAHRVAAVLAEAQATPAGRARVALAAVLAGLPGWTTHDGPRPADDDAAAQQAEMAKTFAMGAFLPRVDQEQRAHGVFSSNTGVDYRAQLALSGRHSLVAKLYAAAGLDLNRDLDALNAGSRVAADPAATRYMLDHYTPNARPTVPTLAVQNIGDGLTSPSLQRAYLEAAEHRARGMTSGLWAADAGHCTFTTPTVLASLHQLETRIDTGRWPVRPAEFVAYDPPPMLRPCLRDGACR